MFAVYLLIIIVALVVIITVIRQASLSGGAERPSPPIDLLDLHPEPEPTFDVVLRGYDRHQVDVYLGNPAPQGPPAFDVVARGYDRAQVNAYLRQRDQG